MLVVAACAGTAALTIAGVGLALAWDAMGKSPSGERLERIKRSPHYKDGKFRNPISVRMWPPGSTRQMAKDYFGGQKRTPDEPPPVIPRTADDYATPPASGLRVTWLGHSSALIEIDGHLVLLDPVFSERLSPVSFVGPKRFFPSPIAIDDLPAVDAVVISHDHYDHLDQPSVTALAPKVGRFVMPLGVGAHLEAWGVPPDKIVELDWWEEIEVGGGWRFAACPARHFSGRTGFGDRTQWAAFAIRAGRHRVFFSGDTGLMPMFDEVGKRYGPFDLTLLKIGAYGRGWPDIHIDPEQAVELHKMVGGRLLMPVHWGTVNLSYHGWTEPAERLIVAAKKAGVDIVIPRPGEMFEPSDPPEVERWWPEIPWERAR